jgi:glycosyltransferase involved in cell wall biosynthesis
MMRVLVCLPPARTSHEIDTLAAMPDCELIALADRPVAAADRTIVLPARRLPWLGRPEAWTLALAWLRGVDEVDVGPVDAVVSLELCSVFSLQAHGLARRLGAPHVVLVEETLANNVVYLFPPWRQMTRRTAERADRFICWTPLAQSHAIARRAPADRTVVVAPGVDVELFHPAPEGRAAAPVVIFVAQLRANFGADKGLREVVAACEQIAPEVPDLVLRVVGDGHLREWIENEARRLPFIEVLGARPREQVADLLRSARVFAMAPARTPKAAEQFGFSLVEAMASGLPVVTTASGAVPQVVPDWNRLVPEGDVDGLAATLRMALGPEGDAWGRRNRETVESSFSLAGQGRAYRDALLGAVPRHSG